MPQAFDGRVNLNPVRSEAEARAKGKRGGIASGKARRRKRALREIALSMRDRASGTDGLTNGEAAVASMYALAASGEKGSVAAFQALVDLMGEKVERHSVEIRDIPRLVFAPPLGGDIGDKAPPDGR